MTGIKGALKASQAYPEGFGNAMARFYKFMQCEMCANINKRLAQLDGPTPLYKMPTRRRLLHALQSWARVIVHSSSRGLAHGGVKA